MIGNTTKSTSTGLQSHQFCGDPNNGFCRQTDDGLEAGSVGWRNSVDHLSSDLMAAHPEEVRQLLRCSVPSALQQPQSKVVQIIERDFGRLLV